MEKSWKKNKNKERKEIATLRNLFSCNYDQAQGIRPENICKWRHHVP